MKLRYVLLRDGEETRPGDQYYGAARRWVDIPEGGLLFVVPGMLVRRLMNTEELP